MANNKSLLYLARDKFDYYDKNLPGILSLNFSGETIHDLEVLNPVAFHLQIKSFIDNNKISPAQTIIVLSPKVYFEKDFPETADFHQDSALQEFIDTIPFENVSTKIYKLNSGSKLLATNVDLYQNIAAPLEETGFIVEAVAPIFILGKDIIAVDNLDVGTANAILDRYEIAKQNSLLLNQDTHLTKQVLHNKSSNKNDNKSLFYLLPILFILIIVLVILYFKSMGS